MIANAFSGIFEFSTRSTRTVGHVYNPRTSTYSLNLEQEPTCPKHIVITVLALVCLGFVAYSFVAGFLPLKLTATEKAILYATSAVVTTICLGGILFAHKYCSNRDSEKAPNFPGQGVIDHYNEKAPEHTPVGSIPPVDFDGGRLVICKDTNASTPFYPPPTPPPPDYAVGPRPTDSEATPLDYAVDPRPTDSEATPPPDYRLHSEADQVYYGWIIRKNNNSDTIIDEKVPIYYVQKKDEEGKNRVKIKRQDVITTWPSVFTALVYTHDQERNSFHYLNEYYVDQEGGQISFAYLDVCNQLPNSLDSSETHEGDSATKAIMLPQNLGRAYINSLCSDFSPQNLLE